MELRSKSESGPANLAPAKPGSFDAGSGHAGSQLAHPTRDPSPPTPRGIPLIFPSFLQLVFILLLLSHLFGRHRSSSEPPAHQQRVLKPRSREHQYNWNLCCSFQGAGTALQLCQISKKRERKKAYKRSEPSCFLWVQKGFESTKNKAANGNWLHRNSCLCILLAGSTKRTRPEHNIRSMWNPEPSLQTSYHDCTCKSVR